jgi:hypothetical protein
MAMHFARKDPHKTHTMLDHQRRASDNALNGHIPAELAPPQHE